MTARCLSVIVSPLRKRFLLLSAVLSLSCSAASADDQQAILNLFGEFMGQAIQQSLRAEWAKVPPDQMFCINLGLSKQGASLQQLISAGVAPNDPRLSACAPLATGYLEANSGRMSPALSRYLTASSRAGATRILLRRQLTGP